VLEFIEPDRDGQIVRLKLLVTDELLARTKLLIERVYKNITELEFPTTEMYDQNLKGILEFEESMLQ
jgi:hypothetical protein